MSLILIAFAAAAALHMLLAGMANPAALDWTFAALAVLVLSTLWQQSRRIAGAAAMSRRTHRDAWTAVLTVAVLVLETEAGLFTALAAGSAESVAAAFDHASVRALIPAGIAAIAAAMLLGGAALRRAGRLSSADFAVGAFITAGLLLLLVRYSLGGDLTAAALAFGDVFAAALIYVPARLFIRSEAQARVTACAAIGIALVLVAASVPALVAATYDALVARSAPMAPTAPPRRWMPEGWALDEGAVVSRLEEGPVSSRFTTRLTAGAGEADLRFMIPTWFVAPGQPVAATAFVRSRDAGHLDLQLFQRDRSVHSSRYRTNGEWQTLVVAIAADEAPAPIGLDVNLSRNASADIEYVTLSGPRGTLQALGAGRMLWEPAGWTLLQPDAHAERVDDEAGERLRLTATTGSLDFRHRVPAGLHRRGQAVEVTAQIFATRPIVHLQLVSGDTVIDTARHRGQGWETLVVTGASPEAPLSIDIDVEPGQADVQSVSVTGGGVLFGTVADLSQLAAAQPPPPREPDPAAATPSQRPSYRDTLALTPARAVPVMAILLAGLAAASVWELLRRSRLAVTATDRRLAVALMLLAIAAYASAAYVPSLSHPGIALTIFLAIAAGHALPVREPS